MAKKTIKLDMPETAEGRLARQEQRIAHVGAEALCNQFRAILAVAETLDNIANLQQAYDDNVKATESARAEHASVRLALAAANDELLDTKRAVTLAKSDAMEIRAQAKTDSDDIRRKARSEASAMVAEAKERSVALNAEADKRQEEIAAHTQALLNEEAQVQARLDALKGELAALKERIA